MGVKLKITGRSEVKPQNEDCYLSQISEKTIVGAMIVGAVIVGAMIVGAVIVGAMTVGAMIGGAMIVGAMRLSLLSSGGERRLAEANEKSDNEGRSRTSPFVPARRC